MDILSWQKNAKMFSGLNKYLKNIPIIYAINAFLKARTTKYRYNRLISYYSNMCEEKGFIYSQKDAITSVLTKISARGIGKKKEKMGKLNIYWVGGHYDQDMSGTLQDLSKFGAVKTFKNSDDGYGLLWPNTAKRKISLEEASLLNSACLLDQVTKIYREQGLDILIGQMWADVLDPAILKKVQDMGIITINIAMDDRLPLLWRTVHGKRMGSIGLATGIDLFLTTSPEACSWYGAENCSALYFPLASNPDIFFPRNEKKYDVVFVGANYGFRGAIVNKLISSGVNVDAFGPGWANGFIGATKTSEIFGKAKIILGVGGVGYNKDILTLKLRDFDATMSGALYITSRNPDLSVLFKEGVEIECYSSFEELFQKIKYYLANPSKRDIIAAAGLKKAKLEHSWERRFRDVFKILDLI